MDAICRALNPWEQSTIELLGRFARKASFTLFLIRALGVACAEEMTTPAARSNDVYGYVPEGA